MCGNRKMKKLNIGRLKQRKRKSAESAPQAKVKVK